MIRFFIRNKLILFCATLIAVYIGLSAAGGVLLMENALHVQRRPLTDRVNFAAMVEGLTTSSVEDVSISTTGGALLKGWYVRPQAWNHDTVILLHGVGDNREGVEDYALMFLRAGYAVLLPDSRAQGESGGTLVTYGFLEADDVRHWADWANNRRRSLLASAGAGCIDLFGESMGAAIALQATAMTPGICAVVAEAPFSSFREIGYERIAQGTKLSVATVRIVAWPMVEFAFLEAQLRYGFHFDRVSPERALTLSHVPALLIAGLADENIPPRHAREIFRVAGASSELWEVSGAGHTAAASVDPATFRRKVIDWFAAHSKTEVN